MTRDGRIIINTGNGKGKTTAALGLAFRTLGHGRRVCVIQFIKGQGIYGERLFAESLENLDWFICGKGFVFKKERLDEDREVARAGFELACRKISSDDYDLIILDELTYLPQFGFIDVEEIVAAIRSKPARLTVVITGRNAPPELVSIADTVTEMQSLKHAFESGVKAQKGIEF
jgi:cob(I)alamin adenosyltransferase